MGLRRSRREQYRAYIEHTVSPGERLDNIAYLHYGNPYAWMPIIEVNRHLIQDDYPTVGTVIRIPILEQSKPLKEQRLSLPLWRRSNSDAQSS